MQIAKKHSLLEHATIFFIALAISMPLFSNWFGSFITYFFYLLGITSSVILNGPRINFSRLDLPLIVFFIAYLFSIFYAVNSDIKTEILFIPLLFILYYGGKGIVKNSLTNLLFTYMTFLFIVFSIYLLYQLSKVDFAYNIYYFYSTASNKVDYLTTAMYAGISTMYLLLTLKTIRFKYILVFYSFFVVTISGARFSIFFILSLLLLLFVIKFKQIIFSKKGVLALLITLLLVPLVISQLEQRHLKKIEQMFSFSIMRISNFNQKNTSLNERVDMIQRSTDAIAKSPFIGYGINSSPKIIKYPYPHNMLLQAWQDTGIIGMLSLLILTLLMFNLLFYINKNKDYRYVGLISLYVILAHLKSFSINHSLLYFTLAGISISLLSALRNQSSSRISL